MRVEKIVILLAGVGKKYCNKKEKTMGRVNKELWPPDVSETRVKRKTMHEKKDLKERIKTWNAQKQA